MTATIKDIARRLNISHTTVSRALRDSPLIAEETAAKIREAAFEMGYYPSAAARSLKTKRSQALGVVVSSIEDPFFGEILQGIDDVAQENGYSLFIAAAQHNPDREQGIVQTLVEHRVDGVIICSTPFSTKQGKHLQEYGVPITVINNQAAEDYWYSIYHDDVNGSRQITRHLIDLGHKRIAYLGNALSGRTNLDRLTGFQIEMTAAGLPVHEEYIHQVQGGKPENGLQGVRHFLELPEPPTGIICYNDMIAIGVLQGSHNASLRVPEELSVTGFDNITFSAFTIPPLTTFDQPKRHIGAEAARLVLGLLSTNGNEGVAVQPKTQMLLGSLLVRKTTAPPPSI